MKTCFKCGKTKPRDDFYSHVRMADGKLGKCKDCTKADVAANYRLRIEQFRLYERTRNQEPARRKSALRYQAKRRLLTPQKTRARNAVANALRAGRLEKSPCQLCGEPQSQAHHGDYSRPLDVEWLCFRCHRNERHGQSAA